VHLKNLIDAVKRSRQESTFRILLFLYDSVLILLIFSGGDLKVEEHLQLSSGGYAQDEPYVLYAF